MRDLDAAAMAEAEEKRFDNDHGRRSI